MSINLHVEPFTKPMSFQEFRATRPGFAAALDGYVAEAPDVDLTPEAPYVNFNHHEGVWRLATRATCSQTLLAVRTGLYDTFYKDGEIWLDAYVNDCDQDVGAAWTVLNNRRLVENPINPIVNRLIGVQELLDTMGGAYPMPADIPTMEELAWINSPYTKLRTRGGLVRKDATEYRDTILDIEERYKRAFNGRGERMKLDVQFDRVGGGKKWDMVHEIGAHARSGMFEKGIRAFVGFQPRPPSPHDPAEFAHLPWPRWQMTVGRMSPFVPFPVPRLLARLSQEEGLPDESWGGGDTIGGSPRSCGTRLSPMDVTEIIEDELARPALPKAA